MDLVNVAGDFSQQRVWEIDLLWRDRSKVNWKSPSVGGGFLNIYKVGPVLEAIDCNLRLSGYR